MLLAPRISNSETHCCWAIPRDRPMLMALQARGVSVSVLKGEIREGVSITKAEETEILGSLKAKEEGGHRKQDKDSLYLPVSFSHRNV